MVDDHLYIVGNILHLNLISPLPMTCLFTKTITQREKQDRNSKSKY